MRRLIALALAVTIVVLHQARAGLMDGWHWRSRSQPMPQEWENLPVIPMIPDETVSAEEAIQAVLNEQVAAWNRGDLEGFMRGYWNSPELTFFSGKEKAQGWQATLERYIKRYRGDGREMGKLAFNDLRIETLGPDAAFVRGRFELEMSKEKLGGLFTLIFKRFPEGWRIVHDHTSG